ncbi:MAG: glycosyltransferase family 2 protein [Anaerolineae bacterium]
MSGLSVIVLTKDEEGNIQDCLATVSWADEVIVLDSYSEDRTVELAQMMGARIHQRPFRDWGDQRNAALGLATGDWVLFVDADERVTPELAEEIKQLLREDVLGGKAGDSAPKPVGYWIPRKNLIFGRWMRHTGWYPDYQLRLMRRGCARYDPARPVHELVILDGAEGCLENHLIHYNYRNLRQFFERQSRYTDFAAQALFRQGVQVKWRNFILQPLREFWRRYWTWSGYRDGWLGFLLSVLMAYYELVMYLRLRWLWAEKDQPGI